MTAKLLALLSVVGVVSVPIAGSTTAAAAAPIDDEVGCSFDGDEYDDLAIGVPRDTAETVESAGSVRVLSGSVSGLSTADAQVWHRNQDAVSGDAEATDDFGRALACGDFDGDGYDDLAIGVPSDVVGGLNNAGSVHIVYGTTDGLATDRNQIWHRDRVGINGRLGASDRFGWSLAAGDFDGDGLDDLAVGVPYDDVDGVTNAGSVHVIFGTVDGLARFDDRIWHRGRGGINGELEASEHFGWSVAAGDVDGDGFDDLATGVPLDMINDKVYSGSVHVIRGTIDGLARFDDQIWHRDRGFVDGTARPQDKFGSSVAIADFDADGFADLAVGAPDDDVHGVGGAGSVQVLHGTERGITALGDQIWHRDASGVSRDAVEGAAFGSAITAADFDADGFADLAMGVPYDDVNDIPWSGHEAGSVHVLYGTGDGLSDSDDAVFDQDTPGTEDEASSGDHFGLSLAAADFDGDGSSDLAVGVPFEQLSHYADGAVAVIHGTAIFGLTSAGNQFWSCESPGISGPTIPQARFGWSVT